jgi:hypothetical protein
MSELPSIDDELAPRKRVDLKALRPAGGDDATVNQNSRRLGSEWGASTTIAPEARTPVASLRIEVPEYLDRALALKAVEQRVTKQFLVLQALRNDGYRIDAVDLVPDRRKSRKL